MPTHYNTNNNISDFTFFTVVYASNAPICVICVQPAVKECWTKYQEFQCDTHKDTEPVVLTLLAELHLIRGKEFSKLSAQFTEPEW